MKKRTLFWVLVSLVVLYTFFSCISNKQSIESIEQREIPTIYIGMSGKRRVSNDYSKINKELGRISESKYNIRIQLVWYENNMESIIAFQGDTGQCVDVFSVYYNTYKTYLGKKLLLDMSPYLKQYGSSLKAVIESKSKAENQVADGIFGIPKPSSDIYKSAILLAKEYVEKYNMDLSTIKNIEDIEPLLEIVKENEPQISPLTTQNANSILPISSIGDLIDDCLSIVKYSDEKAIVYNMFETEEYKNRIKMIRAWKEQEYFSEDLFLKTEIGREEVAEGDAFATEIIYKPEETEYLQSVYDEQVIVVPFDNKPVIKSNSDWVLVWCVAATTKYPREAVVALNALYTDPDIITLINYGVEDVNYIENPDGSIQFLDGVDVNTVGYMNTDKWRINLLKAKRWKGESSNLEEVMETFNNSAEVSPAYGFWLDESKLTVDINKIRDIVSKYKTGFEFGQYPIEDTLTQFQNELREAGADLLLEEVQAQLNEWRMTESKTALE